VIIVIIIIIIIIIIVNIIVIIRLLVYPIDYHTRPEQKITRKHSESSNILSFMLYSWLFIGIAIVNKELF